LHVLSTPPAFILSQDQTLHQHHTHHPQPTTNPNTSQAKTQPPSEPAPDHEQHAHPGPSIIRMHQTQHQHNNTHHNGRHHHANRGMRTGFSHTVEFSRSVTSAPDSSAGSPAAPGATPTFPQAFPCCQIRPLAALPLVSVGLRVSVPPALAGDPGPRWAVRRRARPLGRGNAVGDVS
jgi:hypothetical protein